jgi:hypothetical protein
MPPEPGIAWNLGDDIEKITNFIAHPRQFYPAKHFCSNDSRIVQVPGAKRRDQPLTEIFPCPHRIDDPSRVHKDRCH